MRLPSWLSAPVEALDAWAVAWLARHTAARQAAFERRLGARQAAARPPRPAPPRSAPARVAPPAGPATPPARPAVDPTAVTLPLPHALLRMTLAVADLPASAVRATHGPSRPAPPPMFDIGSFFHRIVAVVTHVAEQLPALHERVDAVARAADERITALETQAEQVAPALEKLALLEKAFGIVDVLPAPKEKSLPDAPAPDAAGGSTSTTTSAGPLAGLRSALQPAA